MCVDLTRFNMIAFQITPQMAADNEVFNGLSRGQCVSIYLSVYLFYYFEVFLVNVAISCLLQLQVNPDVIQVIYFVLV